MIDLHDLVLHEIKRFLAETQGSNFSLQTDVSDQELFQRISRYERAVSTLCSLLALIAYWGKASHKVIL